MPVTTPFSTIALVAILACGGEQGSSRVSISDTTADCGQVAITPDSASLRAPAGMSSASNDTGRASRVRSIETASSVPTASPDTGRVSRADVGVAPEAPPRPPNEPTPAAANPSPTPEPRIAEPRRPFGVGERLTYDVRLGPLSVGTATMEVRGLEPIRGEPAYHAIFRVQGGNRLYRVDDHYESWFGAKSLASLRYIQKIDQGSYERLRTFDIFPDRRVFKEEGKPEEPSVADPLDDASFLYFLRTVPLEVGRTYTYARYFRPDRNPVTVRVMRRERVTVPAGQFDALVVQPTIKTRGIFSEGGRAEVWFADDSTRRIVQIRSQLRFGTLSLHLR